MHLHFYERYPIHIPIGYPDKKCVSFVAFTHFVADWKKKSIKSSELFAVMHELNFTSWHCRAQLFFEQEYTLIFE